MRFVKTFEKFLIIKEEVDFNKDFKITEDELFMVFNDFLLKYLYLSVELVKSDSNSFKIEIFNKNIDQEPDKKLNKEYEEFKSKELDKLNNWLETVDLKVSGEKYDNERQRIVILVSRLKISNS